MEFSFDRYQEDKKLFTFCGESLCYQSDYFNLYLQKSIESLPDGIDKEDLLVTTAQEISYAVFTKFFKNRDRFSKEFVRKKFVQDYYAHCGFGRIDLKSIQPKGGYIEAVSEHYSMAWRDMFGIQGKDKPGVAHFSLGFLCGAVEAIFEVVPGSFRGKQLLCLSKGDSVCKFEIYRGLNRKIRISPGLGKVQSSDVEHPAAIAVANGKSVLEGIMELNLSGTDNKKGLIDQFDMTITKHFANYFSVIQIKLLMQAKNKLGANGMKQIKVMLEKLGERTAYYTVGKLLNSDYWHDYIESSVGKDRESIIQACLDIQTSLGQGEWKLLVATPTDFKAELINYPETNAFLKLVGNTKSSINFFPAGFLMGVAHVLEKGYKSSGGVTLQYVENLVKEGHKFRYKQPSSRMVGEDIDTIAVGKI